MIKNLFIVLFLLFFTNCVGVISKSFENYDPKSTGSRVRKTFIGPMVVFNLFHTNDSIDTKEALYELRKINDCSTLKNIDIEFFNHNYLFIGYQKMIIHADCDRGNNIKTPPTETIKEAPEPDIGT